MRYILPCIGLGLTLNFIGGFINAGPLATFIAMVIAQVGFYIASVQGESA